MGDYLAIIKRNILSPIVIAIFLLAAALLYVHEYRDAWFISVVIVLNSSIGIVQEIRAKRTLKKLEILSAPRARVLQKDGSILEVPYAELAVGDEIQLLTGDEIPADATLQQSHGIEVDESILTGESIAVQKEIGDAVYAATTVVAGSAQAVVEAVGSATKSGQMSAVLKRYSPELTPLQRAIQKAISTLTFGAIALALLIFVVYYFSDHESVTILKTITSAAVTVVPEGLLLASSLLLAFGALKLAQAKVLAQKLSAIEAMALLKLLCVDKTGTLTSDRIVFDEIVPFTGHTKDELSSSAALVASEASGGNATGTAVADALTRPKNYTVADVMAFSSERKISALRVQLDGALQTILMGAPEFIAKVVRVTPSEQTRIDIWAGEGRRVLLVARVHDDDTPLKKLKNCQGDVLGAVLLANPLRKDVQKTVSFLQSQGVSIRVISGDNPKTVQYIAREAGIEHSEAVTTGDALAKLTGTEFAASADAHAIFARVLPEQKERLIAHYKKKGLFTGMVGDGVNDALALKKADLGIAMYAGAAASRRVADILLLNNSFTALPMGMRLGNRIMQAIEVIATLFFHKIIYGVVLLLATMVFGMTYPYAPRHITFMNIFLVTMPTIMWTLFPPLPKHRVDPSRFWKDTLFAIAPIALITGLTVAFTYWAMSVVYPDRSELVATMTVLVATFFGVYMVFLVGRLLGVTLNAQARRARLLYLGAVIFVALTSFSVGFLRDFFDFTSPSILVLRPAIGIITAAALLQWNLAKRTGDTFQKTIH